MKRTLVSILLVLLCTTALPFYFGWSDLAGHQTVSFANAQNAVTNGIFTLKNAITSGNRQMTKADAYNHLYIDPVYTPFSGKADNQLIVKNDLSPSPCRRLLVTVSYTDLSNAVDHKVHYSIWACDKASVITLEYNTVQSNFNTGYCFRASDYNSEYNVSPGIACWIMTMSGPAPAPNSGWSSGSICNDRTVYN